MNVEISNRYAGGDVAATHEGYQIGGNFKYDPNTGKVRKLDVSFSAVSEQGHTVQVGNVSSYIVGDEIRFNFSDIAAQHAVGVATAVGLLVSELEA